MLQLLVLYFLPDVIDHSVCQVYPNTIALVINQPNLLLLIHWFIAQTLRPEINTDTSSNISDLPESSLPPFNVVLPWLGWGIFNKMDITQGGLL